MATVPHQSEENPPLFSLSASHLCQPAATRGSSSRGGDAFGKPRIRTRSSDLPARKGGRPGPMAGCGSVSCDGSLNQTCTLKRALLSAVHPGEGSTVNGGDAGKRGVLP